MALREILAKFGFDIDDKKLDQAKEKTDQYADKLKEVAGVLLGEQLVEGIKGFVSELEGQAGALQDSADRLNVNAQELQRWQLAAKFAGAGAEDLNTGLRILQKSAAEASEGGGDFAQVFNKIGVSIKDAAGQIKPANELLEDTLIGLSEIEDPAVRGNTAIQLLGKGAGALLPLMKDGAEGLDKLLGKMDELGGGISEDALSVLNDAGDRFDELDFTVLSLKSRLAVDLFPTLNQLLQWFTKTILTLGKATEGTNIFKAAVLVLGAIATKVAISMYAKYLPVIAAISLLILLVDDVITAFKGGDSVIGKVIDKLLGPGAGKDFFKWISEGADDMWKRMSKMTNIGDMIAEVFSSIGFTIVKFFVDDIPEAWDFFWKDLNKTAGTGGKTFGDFISAMFSDIWKMIKQWVKDVAKDLVDGLTKGITDAWKKGKDAVKNFFGSIVGTGEEELDVHSPSGETERLGDESVNGILGALAAGAPKVKAQAQATFGQVLTPAGSYAPTVRVQAVATAGQGRDTVRRYEIKNQVSQQFIGNSSASYREAAREGLGMAFDANRQLLASLEPEGG